MNSYRGVLKEMKRFLSLSLVFVLAVLPGCSNQNKITMIPETEKVEESIVEQTTIENTTTLETKETIVENAKANSNEEGEMPTNEILVAYFSATGTTKKVAEKIAEFTGGDIYEIVPKNPYSSADLNWNDRNSRSSKEMDDPNVRPEIGSDDIFLDQYKIIYLGYPIWWGDAPRIMATFVEKYSFDGKKVIPFCTSGGSGIGRSGSNLGTLAGGGNFMTGERLNSSADTNNIQNFINNNK